MKIFFGTIFLLIISLPSKAKDIIFYCYNPLSSGVYQEIIEEKNNSVYKNPLNRCSNEFDTYFEIPINIYNKFQNIQDERRILFSSKYDAGEFTNKGIFGSSNDYKKMKDYSDQTKQILSNFIINSKNEIEEYNRNRSQIVKQEIESQKKLEAEMRITKLEKAYSGKCNFGYIKGTEKYNNCLLEQEKKDLAEQKKKQELAEASRKKSEAEAKQMSDKLAKMSPDDRRAYTCSEKFGFRKGSDNFKECVFKIYSAEIELEKIELQKQLAKANADLAKANAASNQKLADAQTAAAIMQAYAAQQQAIAANTADSLALMESGLRMMSPQRPAARAPMNCQYHAKMLSCF